MRLEAVGGDAAVALAEVHAAAFDAPWSAHAFRELFASPGVAALAAMAGQKLVGFVLARVVCDEAEVLTLAVRPQMRRAGLATALTQGISAAAEALGAGVLWLEVAEDNAPALGLYRRCGFEQAGRRPGYYAGPPPVDALVMRRRLNTAPA